MKISFSQRRVELRRSLQAQRQAFDRQFSVAAHANESYSRGIVMSLLNRPSTLAVWAVRELLPLILLHWLGSAGSHVKLRTPR